MTKINRPLGWTTLEEAQQLVEAGLSTETADMYYFLDPTPAGNIYHLTVKRIDVGVRNLPEYSNGDLPCWSLGALMQFLPRTIEQGYDLLINPQFYVIYINLFSEDVKFVCDMSSFLIENVKDAIIWLLNNKML